MQMDRGGVPALRQVVSKSLGAIDHIDGRTSLTIRMVEVRFSLKEVRFPGTRPWGGPQESKGGADEDRDQP
jgi:hypothetical protein